jgi:hypothetical protein
MANKIAGTTYIKVDGQQFTLAGRITVSTSTVEREGKVGLSGVAGFKESPRVPFIEGDFHTTEDLSLEDLEEITRATVKVELANGKNYILRDAWCTGALEIDGAEGQISVRFEGMAGKEI